MKILANDGISIEAIHELEKAGFSVCTETIPQDQLIQSINSEGYVAILVRSATTIRKELIDACPNIKLIGRGGVGMDNIDVDYARSKGVFVINTPGASSQSVAELVMGHLFALSRDLHQSYRMMPETGSSEFKYLKKRFAKGQELKGKTIGIVGFGRIGQALAGYAYGIGMKVKAIDIQTNPVKIPIRIEEIGALEVTITPTNNLQELIGELDYISFHVPKQSSGKAVIDDSLISKMKDGVILVNAARGGVIDEDALIEGLKSGKIRGAALDVFENEPSPREDLLIHDKIASTPHIGAATNEAQERIGLELAEQIIKLLKTN